MTFRISRILAPASLFLLGSLFSTTVQAADSDADGVDDAADLFPCDVNFTSVQHIPSQNTYASLFFEDQWPARDDLDLNDVVLDYNFALLRNGQNQTKRLQASLYVRAHGGTRNLGLALHLPLPLNAATSSATYTVTIGSGATATTTTLTPKAGESEVVLVLTENIRNALFAGQAGPINADDAIANVTGKAMVVTANFTTPVTLNAADAPFDLFVFREGDYTHQIHRSRFRGTDLMNRTLFGQDEDGSDAGAATNNGGGTRFFVDTNGVPFVLEMPTSAPHPREKVRIDTLFPRIVNFAATRGGSDSDFFLTPTSIHAARQAPSAPAPAPHTNNTNVCDLASEDRVPRQELVLWLRAHDLRETGLAVAGGAVTRWNSASSVASLTTFASDVGSSFRPVLTAGAIGGQDAVTFDGVNDMLALSENIFAESNLPLTIFAVTRSTDQRGHIIGTGSSSSGFASVFGTGLVIDNNTIKAKALNNGVGTVVSLPERMDADSVPRVISAVLVDGGSQVFLENHGSTVSAQNLASFGYTRATIGASDGSNTGATQDPFAGQIAEILVYRGALNTADREAITSYLHAKYQIPSDYCADGVKNTSESDVDCGGGLCGFCGVGQNCNGATDCQNNICDVANTTTANQTFVGVCSEISDSSSVVQAAGMRTWLRAHDLADPTVAGLSNGSRVSTWPTFSGLIGAAQATGINRPTFRTNAIGGKETVAFDGSDDRLDMSNTFFSTGNYPMTTFVVLKTDRLSQHIFGTGSSSSGFLSSFGSGLITTGGLPTWKANNSSSGVFLSHSTSINNNQPHILSSIIQTGSSVVYVGLTPSSVSSSAINPFGYSRATIGASDGSATGASRDPFSGQIAEILVYNRALSAQEHANVVRYLGNKYSIVP